MMAARMAHSFETIDTVAIYDASSDPTLTDDTFMPPFSIRTMLAEYVQPAPVLRRGRMIAAPPHSAPESIDFRSPIGRVTAATVIHSETATLPDYLKDKKVKNIAFKIVYPDCVKRQLGLLVGMGLAADDPVELDGHRVSPRGFLTALGARAAAQAPAVAPRDFEVLRVRMEGTRHGRPLAKTWDCEIRPVGGLSAGALGVGFTGAIGASMAALGQGKARCGAASSESALDEDVFFRELRRRKAFSLIETISQPLAI